MRQTRGHSRDDRYLDDERAGNSAGWLFALGASAGLAVGMYLAGRRGLEALESAPGAERLVRGARAAADRLRPGRLRRAAASQAALTRLEDTVLDALNKDEVLSERGVDVGAISPGIVELSGSVRTSAEAARAVSLTSALPGVQTVVNRLDVEAEIPRGGVDEGSGREWTGRVSGMGSPRVSRGQDPDQSDDSQHIREVSLEHADRQDFEEAAGVHSRPRLAARPSPHPVNPTDFRETELDNQDPIGQHRTRGPEEQPQELRGLSRVGEGLKPGTELRLEGADVPVKPHAGSRPTDMGVDGR